MRIKKQLGKILKLNKFNTQLVVFLLIQVVVIALSISFVFYSTASKEMRETSIAFSNEFLQMKAFELEQYIDQIDQYFLDILYQNEPYLFLEMAAQLDIKNVFIEQERQTLYTREANKIAATFDKMVVARKEIQGLALLDNTGHIWVYDNYTKYTDEIQNILTNELFTKISAKLKRADSNQVAYIYRNEQKQSYVFFVRKLNDLNDYEQAGYLVMLADKQYFDQMIEYETNDMSGHQFLLYDLEDKVIYKDINYDKKAIEKFIDKNIYWENNAIRNQLLVRANIENANWTIVELHDFNILYSRIFNLKKKIFLIGGSISVLFILVSLLFARGVVKPIHELTNAMKMVREGQTNVSVLVQRQDEIGYMGETFNHMISENNKLVTTVYREQITKKDSELKALQAQINPHFLFNTLESISWMARLEGVDLISGMVENLADIMEAGIGKGEEFISLESEIEYIKKYLSIIKSRFGERLEIKYNIKDTCKNQTIPKLLTQPLIENAIYHGVAKTRKGGCIYIGADEIDELIEITICNSGKGLTAQQVEDINNELNTSSDNYFYQLKENQKKHIGLENVNRRIKLYYGEQFGLQISSKYNFYTKVVAKIPNKRGNINV